MTNNAKKKEGATVTEIRHARKKKTKAPARKLNVQADMPETMQRPKGFSVRVAVAGRERVTYL